MANIIRLNGAGARRVTATKYMHDAGMLTGYCGGVPGVKNTLVASLYSAILWEMDFLIEQRFRVFS